MTPHHSCKLLLAYRDQLLGYRHILVLEDKVDTSKEQTDMTELCTDLRCTSDTLESWHFQRTIHTCMGFGVRIGREKHKSFEMTHTFFLDEDEASMILHAKHVPCRAALK